LTVSENRVLRRIFAPKREAVVGDWRRLHNEEVYDLYASPSVVRVIISRWMSWPEHVALMGEDNAYKIFDRRTLREESIRKNKA